MPTILKDDGAFEVSLLCKGITDNGELNAIVYAPEFRDIQGDIASVDVIKDMAYAAARDGLEIDVRHDNKPLDRDRAFIAEHFIVQKGDPRFLGLTDYNGLAVNPTGAWAVVVKIEDPELRKLYSEGGWQGISMAGTAEIEHEKEDTNEIADRVLEALEKRLAHNSTEEDMPLSAEDLKKIEEQTTNIVTAALAVLTKADEPQADETKPKSENQVPVFKGDASCKSDVDAHLKTLQKHKLEQGVDWSDPESVQQHSQALTELEKDSDSGDEGSAEIERLQAKIKKLQGASRQGSGKVTAPKKTNTPPAMHVEGLEKNDQLQEALAAGAAMAAYSNQRRGFSR